MSCIVRLVERSFCVSFLHSSPFVLHCEHVEPTLRCCQRWIAPEKRLPKRAELVANKCGGQTPSTTAACGDD